MKTSLQDMFEEKVISESSYRKYREEAENLEKILRGNQKGIEGN